MCSVVAFWASVRDVKSRGEIVSKGSNSEFGVVESLKVVVVVDLNRAEARDNMEDCRTTGEGRIFGRFNGEAHIEENYLVSLVLGAQLKYSR